MILLSNEKGYKYINKEKLIQVRPIQIKQEILNLESEETVEELLSQRKKQIDLFTTKLSELQQEYKLKKEELEKELEEKRHSWQEEKQKYVEEAREVGFQAGFNEGKEESLEKYYNKIEEINRLAKLAKKDYESTVEASMDAILKLAITSAEKILSEKIEKDPSNFISIVEGALKTVKIDDFVHVFVHASKYELFIQHKEQLQRVLDGQTKIQIFIDNDLAENSSIIEHPFGQVDVSVDTQLKEIHRVLQNINNGE